jgi:hypothetical protein
MLTRSLALTRFVQAGYLSGSYRIKPEGYFGAPICVYCEMRDDDDGAGGGWTLVCVHAGVRVFGCPPARSRCCCAMLALLLVMFAIARLRCCWYSYVRYVPK